MTGNAKPKIGIKRLPKTKRPREKLAVLGAANLSEAELVAIILGSGTAGQNVLKLARQFLKKHSLESLPRISIQKLSATKGIGSVQAGKLQAAVELGRRIFRTVPVKVIRRPEQAAAETAELAGKRQEYLVALYLNARDELLEKQVVALGSLNTSSVEPRDVFAPALALPCGRVILVHNHPSGDPSPSRDDKNLTIAIAEAGEILGIRLVDHLIITKRDYFSFREAGLL